MFCGICVCYCKFLHITLLKLKVQAVRLMKTR